MNQIDTSAASVRIDILSNFAQMRERFVSEPAECLRGADLFQTVDWFENLAVYGFVHGAQAWLPCLVDRDSGRAVVLPLAFSASAGLQSLSNYYSSLFGPVGGAWPATTAWKELALTMRRQQGGALVDLRPLDAQGQFMAVMQAALRAAGYWVDCYDCFGNWYLPVMHASFDEYAASLPAALRHSIGRGRRRLEREGGFSLRIHSALGPDLAQAIVDFESVYAQSWKKPEPCPQFMPELMRMAAERGWLRLGIVQVQGRPIAAQLWLVKDGKANIYKLAYVQGFERFSPGSVLTAALMAHVMDVDRVREVDYLTGDDAYKRDWMTHRRVRVGLVAYDPLRVRGLAGAARHFGGRGWRAMQALLVGMLPSRTSTTKR